MKIRDKDLRLAVLIDADNISSQYIKPMMDEIARYGTPTIKRIYGDWTKQNMNRWKKVLLDYALSPIQQFGYTYGKNSTDTALIIDAMDILYEDQVDGFCIVSSDSDFTRLAMRLREASKYVIGIGEQKTPQSFIAACDRFIFLEILNYDEVSEFNYAELSPGTEASLITIEKSTPKPQSPKQAASRPGAPTIRNIDENVYNLIHNTIDSLADDSGWAFLGDVGNLLLKTNPSFDSRNYGFSKLSALIREVRDIELEERATEHPNVKHIYIRSHR